jgi:hypothetical protein
MELFNDIQIEVNQIVVLHNKTTMVKTVFKLKRLIYLSEIQDISQYFYKDENGERKKCSAITLFRMAGWFKVTDSYKDLKETLTKWNADGIAREIQQATE